MVSKRINWWEVGYFCHSFLITTFRLIEFKRSNLSDENEIKRLIFLVRLRQDNLTNKTVIKKTPTEVSN